MAEVHGEPPSYDKTMELGNYPQPGDKDHSGQTHSEPPPAYVVQAPAGHHQIVTSPQHGYDNIGYMHDPSMMMMTHHQQHIQRTTQMTVITAQPRAVCRQTRAVRRQTWGVCRQPRATVLITVPRSHAPPFSMYIFYNTLRSCAITSSGSDTSYKDVDFIPKKVCRMVVLFHW